MESGAVSSFLSEHSVMLGDMAKVAGENTVKLRQFCMANEAIFFLKCKSHSRNIMEQPIT